MQRTGAIRPGGRTARTEQVVHAAVRELTDDGALRPSIAAVAHLAGVSPATIYRRWGSIDGLLLDVAISDRDERASASTSGELLQDLLDYGRQINANVTQPGGLAFFRAIVAVGSSPDRGPQHAFDLLRARIDQFEAILDAWAGSTSLTVTDVIDGLLAPIYLRALISQPSTLDDADLSRLVDNLRVVDLQRRLASTDDIDPSAQ